MRSSTRLPTAVILPEMIVSTARRIAGEFSRYAIAGAQPMHRHPHVLNAASNLLGICFVLIGALKFTRSDATSFADETAWLSAALFLTSIVASYAAIRSNEANRLQNLTADIAFFGGVAMLALAMVITAIVL